MTFMFVFFGDDISQELRIKGHTLSNTICCSYKDAGSQKGKACLMDLKSMHWFKYHRYPYPSHGTPWFVPFA